MTKLFFITHPSVVISAAVPVDEWPLSEKGIREAQALSKQPFWSEVTALYASTEPKSYTTAQRMEAAHPHLAHVKVDALKEIDRSSTSLMPIDEYMDVVKQFYAEPDTSVRGWEPATQARQRITSAVREVMQKHSGEVVAIIGHGATGTLLACDIKDIASSFAEDPKRTACFMEIDWDTRRILRPWEAYGEALHEVRSELIQHKLK